MRRYFSANERAPHLRASWHIDHFELAIHETRDGSLVRLVTLSHEQAIDLAKQILDRAGARHPPAEGEL